MEAISLKLPEDLLEDSARCAEALKMSRAAYDLFWADPLTMQRHLDGLESVYAAALETLTRSGKTARTG